MGTDEVQFVLTKAGMEIGKNFKTNIKAKDSEEFELRETKLLCNKNQVNPGTYEMIKWADNHHTLWGDPHCTVFTLSPVRASLENFHIEMPYGNIHPRLISYDRDIRFRSYLACSAKRSLGYDQEDQCVWTIK